MPTTTSPALGALTTPPGSFAHTTEASGLTEDVRRYEVIRRTGELTRFDASKMQVAMIKAFLAVEGSEAAASRRIHDIVEHLTAQVIEALFRRLPDGGAVHIEDIQDHVELALMRDGHHKVARAYVLYREERARQREARTRQRAEPSAPPVLSVTRADGSKHPLDQERLTAVTEEACAGLADVSARRILQDTMHNLFDGMPEGDVGRVLTMSARALIEQEPNYSYVAARLLLDALRHEALSCLSQRHEVAT